MIKLVSLKNNDNINIINYINEYNAPEKIFVPIIFFDKENDLKEYVYKNSYFKNYIVSISGVVSGIKEIKYNNSNVKSLVIKNDFKENLLTKKRKIKINNKDELLSALSKNYLNDILNKIITLKDIKKLVISSIDEECYTVKEFIRLSYNYKEILDTIDLLINIFNLNNAILATKNTNFKSIKNVKSIIGIYPNVRVNLVPDKYLISRDEFLCDYLSIKQDETLILTTNEIYLIYNILNGKVINDNLITISGNALEKSVIINTRLGVSLKELLKEYITIIDNDYEIYINGYLKGYKILNNEDIIITKEIDYIVINKKELVEENECINCGACNRICPYNINVKKCYENRLNHKKCIGCGLCNYICPSNIDLKKIVKSDKIEKKQK